MKMIVSDYDDTFYINDEDIKMNVNIVKEFMKNNIFVIATGRSYLDYQKKKDLYQISSSYLIINHGTTILKDDHVIYNITIDNSIKNKLLADLKIETTITSFACSKKESRISLDNDNLTKIHVKYKTSKEAFQINEILINKYSDKITTFLVCKDTAIEIIAKEVSKANAIKYISKLESIEENNIYTIGDNYNDLEMIKNFNGFAMVNSVKEVKEVAIKEYESVYDLIIEVMRSSNEEFN